MKTLVIDDLRFFETASVHARNYEEGIYQLKNCGPWDLLYLDHDLGEDKTGYDVMCWLEENTEYLPGEIVCVSANPVGKDRITQVIDKLYNRA